jgi:cytochrome c peroxidase
VPIPEDNPMTAEKVELGRMLYFDKRVSKDGTISCATCHDPKLGWAERTPTSTGINQQVGGRNAPTVINSAYAPAQFWDGRAASLEEQAVGPVGNSIEMGHSMAAVVASFNEIPEYKERFQKVFGTDVTEDGFAKAVAAFERTVLSGNSPYDKFQAGDKTAMSESAQRGMKLFEDAGCANCHEPPLFSSYDYENAGVGTGAEKPDLGRMDVTKDEEDKGKFRIPALRSIADTAPYFHDGSAKALDDAVALMAGGGVDNPNLSEMLKEVGEAKIDEQGRNDLCEFLKALSGEYPKTEPPELP